MTKPRNFPERKRQRRLGALHRMRPISEKGNNNAREIAHLIDLTSGGSQREVRTKKYRGAAQ